MTVSCAIRLEHMILSTTSGEMTHVQQEPVFPWPKGDFWVISSISCGLLCVLLFCVMYFWVTDICELAYMVWDIQWVVMCVVYMCVGGVGTNGGPQCLFDTLATYKVILGRVPTCDSAHSWQLHSPTPLGNKAASTMTGKNRFPTQSHYPDTEPTSPSSILIMPSI